MDCNSDGALVHDVEWLCLSEISLGGTRNGIYKSKEFHGRGVKVVNMGELFAFPRLHDEDMKRIDVSPDELNRFSLQEGDLLFARRSLVADGAGKCSIVMKCVEATVFESSIIRVRPSRDRVVPEYLFYLFRSPVGDQLLDTIRKRDAVSGITGKDLANLKVPVPMLKRQERISGLLRVLEDRIDHNRAVAANLEAIARALFKSWFVDFDPVRARAAGDAPLGLAPDLAALFPDRFVDSELGDVPNEWKVGTVEDLLVLQRGFDLPATQRTNGPFPVFSAGGLHGSHNMAMVTGPGVTTGRSGVIGNVYFVHEDFWPLNTSLWVKQFKAATPEYAYQYLRTIDLKGLGSGSAVPTLNRNAVHAQPAIIPPAELVAAYSGVASSLLNGVKVAEQQARTLIAIRDLLLPRLISGKLRVEDAEAALEAA